MSKVSAVVRFGHLENITQLRPAYDGTQAIFKFPNGYGASVICHSGSYGHEQGLWELAVLDTSGELCYDTPITGDVLGWLTPEDVCQYLDQIQALSECSGNCNDNYDGGDYDEDY